VAPRGTTREKKIGGRKRHLLVDTLGLIWALGVLPAAVPDRDGAKTLWGRVGRSLPRLAVIWADSAYASVTDGVGNTLGWILTTILRPVGAQGDVHRPQRWIVERTLGWLGRYRRWSKDYETKPRRSETWIYITMIHRMARAMLPNRRDENRLRKRPKRRKK
jgi:putative transposase